LEEIAPQKVLPTPVQVCGEVAYRGDDVRAVGRLQTRDAYGNLRVHARLLVPPGGLRRRTFLRVGHVFAASWLLRPLLLRRGEGARGGEQQDEERGEAGGGIRAPPV